MDEVIYLTPDIFMYKKDDGTVSCGVSSGILLEQGDGNFHHISCGECQTYWENTSDFEEEAEKNLEVTDDGIIFKKS